MTMRALFFGAAIGFFLGAGMIVAVFATGQTFGQRCAALGHDAAALDGCLSKLANGKRP